MMIIKLLTLLICIGASTNAAIGGAQNLTSAPPRSFVRTYSASSYVRTWSSRAMRTSSLPRVQEKTISESDVQTFLAHCNKQAICEIKWETFIPYVFYVYPGGSPTHNVSTLNVFDRLNYTRLNYQMHYKGDAAVIAGEAILQTAALFNKKFKFVRAVRGILNPAGFSGESRRGTAKVYKFHKRGHFEMAWRDFSALEPRSVRRYRTGRKDTALSGAIDTGNGEEAKVTLKNATKPSLIIRTQKMTVKLKYGSSRKIMKTVVNNHFYNFSALSQAAKNVFHDIYGNLAIFFIHEYNMLSKGCFTEKLFTFDKHDRTRVGAEPESAAVEPKTISGLVDFLKAVDRFGLFKLNNEFCKTKSTTTIIYTGLLSGLGPW